MSKFTVIKSATGEFPFAPLHATGTYQALQGRKQDFEYTYRIQRKYIH